MKRALRLGSAVLAGSLMLAVAAAVLAAAPVDESDSGLESRVFRILHRGVDEAYHAIAELVGPRGEVTLRKDPPRLGVRDEPERLSEIAEVLDRFDVPPGTVRLVLSLVRAEVRRDAPQQTLPGVPPDLSQFAKFNVFHSIGATELVVDEQSSGSSELGVQYRVRVHLGAIDRLKQTVEIQKLSLMKAWTTKAGETQLRTVWEFSERLRAGQRHILSGTSPRHANRRALFLSVEAAILGGR